MLIYDDFRADNEATVRQVLRFLGVDDTFAGRAVEANPTRARALAALDELVRSLYARTRPGVARGRKGASRRVVPDAAARAARSRRCAAARSSTARPSRPTRS